MSAAEKNKEDEDEKDKVRGINIGVMRNRRIKKEGATPEDKPTWIEVKQINFILTEIFSLSFWKECVIDGSMQFYETWSTLITLFLLYNSFFLVARQAFAKDVYQNSITFIALDYSSDLLYIIDMLISSRLGFIEDGIFQMDPKKLWINYKTSFQFKVDIISILPTDVLYFAVGIGSALVRVNRVLRIYRLRQLFDILETRTSFPNLTRIIHLLVYVMLIIHWNACMYFALSKYLGLGSDEWSYPNTLINFDLLPEDHVYRSTLHEYVVTLWWSVLTLTTIGDTDPPSETIAYVYMIVCCMCGVLIFASIFGNVGAMINNANVVRDEFRKKMDDVKQYMVARQVCPILQSRVLNWFNYTWMTRQTLDETGALNCLPYNLQAGIAMQVHLDTLRKVRLFQDCEAGLLNELVLKLKLQVFSPGDFVCRKGDVGREMFIVKSGKLEVVSEDLTRVFKVFGEGESFGDLSILTIPGNKHGNKRTANVRSVGFTDLFSLSKSDLLQALEDYPEAKTILVEKATEILRRDGAVDDELAAKAAFESTEGKVANTWEIVHRLKAKIDRNRQSQQKIEESLSEKINATMDMIEDIRTIMMVGLNVEIEPASEPTGPMYRYPESITSSYTGLADQNQDSEAPNPTDEGDTKE